MIRKIQYAVVSLGLSIVFGAMVFHTSANPVSNTLSSPFQRKILATLPEAPLNLRFFTTGVKTDSRGRIITGPNRDPVKDIVGQESAGERGGLQRYTKIMFGAKYVDGRPDP